MSCRSNFHDLTIECVNLKVTTEAALGLIGGTMGLLTGFSILSGLLTGFSILSGVEIIYYLLRSNI